VLRTFDGKPIKNADDFKQKISAKKIGETVKIEVWHEGAKKTVPMKIIAKPDDAV
jgi:PDZ domain-containing secreted protein